MAFKKRTAATDTTEVAATQVQTKPNLKAEIENFKLEIESALTDSLAIEDTDLPESIQAGLIEISKLIGFEAYDPENTATFFFSVRDDGGKYLYGPSLRAYGDSCSILWADHRIEIEEGQSLSSELFQIVPDNGGAFLLTDVAGYSFPIDVKISGAYRKDEAFKTKLLTLRTAGALSTYLDRGEPMVKWADIEDGAAIEFYDRTPVFDKKEETKIRFGVVLGTLNEVPTRFYLPGQWEEWDSIPFSFENPVVVTKEGGEIKVGDKTFKGAYKKLSELEVGKTYSVVGFKPQDGQFGLQCNLQCVDGASAFSVNGNTHLQQRLLVPNPPEISEDNPAKLIIDMITEMRNGNKRVTCRLITSSDEVNPLLEKLKAKAAFAAKQRSSEPVAAL